MNFLKLHSDGIEGYVAVEHIIAIFPAVDEIQTKLITTNAALLVDETPETIYRMISTADASSIGGFDEATTTESLDVTLLDGSEDK